MEREDGMRLWCYDAEDAAEGFVKRWDAEGDYICIGGETIEVSVAPMENPDDVQTFTVYGEMCPVYRVQDT